MSMFSEIAKEGMCEDIFNSLNKLEKAILDKESSIKLDHYSTKVVPELSISEEDLKALIVTLKEIVSYHSAD